jgi:hypothetical protein
MTPVATLNERIRMIIAIIYPFHLPSLRHTFFVFLLVLFLVLFDDIFSLRASPLYEVRNLLLELKVFSLHCVDSRKKGS